VERDKENPAPLVRYGDFLEETKKDYDAAILQYRQALMWRPDDTSIKDKISDIYFEMGRAHLQQNERALAEARYLEALKWAPDSTSAQHQKIKTEMRQLNRY
jgi:Tfp pilus assembly protein PilF